MHIHERAEAHRKSVVSAHLEVLALADNPPSHRRAELAGRAATAREVVRRYSSEHPRDRTETLRECLGFIRFVDRVRSWEVGSHSQRGRGGVRVSVR